MLRPARRRLAMLFNAPIFFVFAAVFFAGWLLLRSQAGRLRWIVVASFVFYGYWDWRFLFLLLFTGLIDFAAAIAIARLPTGGRRRAALLVSLGANLGILGTFKYLGFVAHALGQLAGVFGLSLAAPSGLADLILPVGVSFYTFQSMSYTIDVYRGECPVTRSPLLFFAYLSYFPQLVAGPIERSHHLMSQLGERRTASPAQVAEGWRLIAIGYFQKSVIADNVAAPVDAAFAHAQGLTSGLGWWLTAVLFAAQIYGDFAGYSNIARGLAKLMGVDLLVNFDRPYLARSFRDFWQRWHISLSTWFRDYVYKPIGGSRRGRRRGYAALWLTMLVSGLWHGAAWTFLAWGALHAAFMTIERLTRWPAWLEVRGALGRLAAQAIVLVGVLVGWILFRADSLGQAGLVLGRMFDPRTFVNPITGWTLPLAVLAVALVPWLASTIARALGRELQLGRAEPVFLSLLVVATIYFRGPGHTFIYFQF